MHDYHLLLDLKNRGEPNKKEINYTRGVLFYAPKMKLAVAFTAVAKSHDGFTVVLNVTRFMGYWRGRDQSETMDYNEN